MITDNTVNKHVSCGKAGAGAPAPIALPPHLDTSALKHTPTPTPRQPLPKRASRDSLVSLQQLAARAGSAGVRHPHTARISTHTHGVRKYIDADASRYAQKKRAQPPSLSEVPTASLQYMRPGAVFSGCQVSGYKRYRVSVEIWRAEFPADTPAGSIGSHTPHVAGQLTIRGLTPANPCMSTYFEGYAVTGGAATGAPGGFFSRGWPAALRDMTASDATDAEHWMRFPACKQLSAKHGKLPQHIADYSQQRYVYMRWKEKFMLPDPEADGVAGASYDGFYYIVLDQQEGTVQGYYYQEQADKFQHLELRCEGAAPAPAPLACDFEMA